jgi:hypothetical protein
MMEEDLKLKLIELHLQGHFPAYEGKCPQGRIEENEGCKETPGNRLFWSRSFNGCYMRPCDRHVGAYFISHNEVKL